MASLSVKSEVLSDLRYELLARLSGFDRYSCIGRVASLVAAAKWRGAHTLDPAYIAAVFQCDEERAGALMERCEIGVVEQDGIRLRLDTGIRA